MNIVRFSGPPAGGVATLLEVRTVSEILWVQNARRLQRGPKAGVEAFAPDVIDSVRAFHATIPGYEPTPLVGLPALAASLGLASLHVKDESRRFGLNAFKVLGGSYAIARLLARRLGRDLSTLPYPVLTSESVRAELGPMVFATTTDGNHGRGVAWTARVLGQRAVVYMPKGTAPFRLERIRAEGARAEILDRNYDDCVRFTAAEAEREGWVVVQDTAWEGYRDIPLWIMEGYGTMVAEALDQIEARGDALPTHVFIQAGVGSLAAAVQAVLVARLGEAAPQVIVVEAERAACFYKSALAGNDVPLAVTGDLDTVMAGLACGEANVIAFDILRDYAAAFLACPDPVSARGMRLLGNPLRGDAPIVSGESGAVTAGLLSFLMADPRQRPLRDFLGLGARSSVLLFSTEGDTDPDRYRSIVWDGEFPTVGLSLEGR